MFIDHVLSTSFGYDKAFKGGEDDRVFVLTYPSWILGDSTFELLRRLKEDINALISIHSGKSAY